MRVVCLSGMMLVFGLAAAYGQGKDAATGLPVLPAAETMVAGKSYGFQPAQLPPGKVCKSTMSGDFYAIQDMNVKDKNITVNTVIAWYAAHLPGFKKTQGSTSEPAGSRSQTIFYNSDGTIVVSITGAPGKQGQDTPTYSVAYERYSPGLSGKTITSMTQGKLACP